VQVAEALTARARPWGRVLAEDDAGPLIVAGEQGGTRSIYLGFNPVVPQSDFCLKFAFPIFISNCVNWLAERPGHGDSLQVRARCPARRWPRPRPRHGRQSHRAQ